MHSRLIRTLSTRPLAIWRSRLNIVEPVNLAPVLAIILLFSLLGALLWLLRANEQEQARLDLVRDTLWVERALQFQIANDQEILQRMADDLSHDAATARFTAQARQLLTSDPAIALVGWLTSDGTVKTEEAQRGLSANELSIGNLAEITESLRRRSGTALAVTGPFKLGETMVFGEIAAIQSNNASAAALVAVVSYDRMLAQNIPWWIAEKRAVELRDHEGLLLASRVRSVADAQAPSHTIAFGVQPAGLFITLFAIREPTNLTRNGLIGAILILGILAVGGLLARENHLRKRRIAENELKKEHAFRTAMEDALTIGMRARDLDGKIIYVNQAFCQMVGWSSEELVGRGPPMPYWFPDELEKTSAFHEQVLSGTPPPEGVELTFKRRDGKLLTALIYEAPLVGVDGRRSGWMGSFIDITERKLAAALAQKQADQIQNTSRLVLIGEMTSILAHDLNQPLATIASYQTGLINHLAKGPVAPADLIATLTKMGDATQRAGSIIRHVQDFVQRNEPRFEHTDITELSARIIAIFQREPRALAIRIGLSAETGHCFGRCDVVLIEQVLINLLRNAAEAMVGLPKRKRRIEVVVSRTEQNIEVQVVDHGPGIAAEMVGDIFRPFVSTKVNGMGLGLTICRSVLEAHRSQLTCSTRSGGGSIFKFRLSAEP